MRTWLCGRVCVWVCMFMNVYVCFGEWAGLCICATVLWELQTLFQQRRKKGTPNTVFCPKVLTPVHIVQRLNGQRDPYMRPTLVQKGIYSVIFQPGISMNNTYLYNGAKCSRVCIRDCTASFVWLSYVVKWVNASLLLVNNKNNTWFKKGMKQFFLVWYCCHNFGSIVVIQLRNKTITTGYCSKAKHYYTKPCNV